MSLAAGYSAREMWRHVFAVGRKRDLAELAGYLEQRYGTDSSASENSANRGGDDGAPRAILCKNGRSALCLALKAYFNKGDKVIVNGFTCYAVVEAVKAAGLRPVYADISRMDLNFDVEDLAKVIDRGVKGMIIQNSLGNPVNAGRMVKFAREHNLVIIEDLAHCAGVKYPDGREAGTVGAAAVFSFGKDKSIDTVSGGAVVLRDPCKHEVEAPFRPPRPSDHMRARFYPLFGAICRGLTSVHLGGVLMRLLVKMHWVEKSADNRLDSTRRMSKFEARLALEQFKRLKRAGEPPLREFYLVHDRDKVLRELRGAGYYFDGLWYEKPVSPERYYRKVHFPEAECPVATGVAAKIVNFPTYYSRGVLAKAREIVEKYLVEGGKNECG